MEAIVIFWVLVFFSFLEATLPESGHSTGEQEDMMIEKPTFWSKEEFLKCLEHEEHDWRDAAKELLKIGIEKSPDSVKDIIMDFIRTGNVDKFKFMIEKGSISPDLNDGLFLIEACENGQESIVNYLLRFTNLLLPYADKCLFVASKKGDDQLVKLLLALKGFDPAVDNNYAIRSASENGHIEVVRLLLNSGKVNPATVDNE